MLFRSYSAESGRANSPSAACRPAATHALVCSFRRGGSKSILVCFLQRRKSTPSPRRVLLPFDLTTEAVGQIQGDHHHAPSSGSARSMAEGNGDDRLSDLPDDILLTILDRLHVREAARTGALSRRWRQLPAMLSQLVIDVWDFLEIGRAHV